jgi:hypothetical protein
MTKTGRWPACSRRFVGERSAHTTSPCFSILAAASIPRD